MRDGVMVGFAKDVLALLLIMGLGAVIVVAVTRC